MIPYLDLKAQYRSMKDEIDAALRRVIESGVFILGPEGKAFEEELAAYCGVKYAVGLNSGTDALELALRAHGIQPGDEVITTPFTFIATAEVIAAVGAVPVFVDIGDDYNIDVAKIADAITPMTRAIIPVHLYGLPADMDAINVLAESRNLIVIEDAAQAIGADYKGKRVGSLGHSCCFSFFPAKNLGCYGDAGAVVTNDPGVTTKIRKLRNHGSTAKYQHEMLGCSSRMDELQAAILRTKLPRVDSWNDRRKWIAAWYSQKLSEVPGVLSVPESGVSESQVGTKKSPCVWQQYTIRVEQRDELAASLKERGVPTAIHYPKPLHLQRAFAYLGYAEGEFPEAEKASREVLSLPCYPEMPLEHIGLVVESIRSFYAPVRS